MAAVTVGVRDICALLHSRQLYRSELSTDPTRLEKKTSVTASTLIPGNSKGTEVRNKVWGKQKIQSGTNTLSYRRRRCETTQQLGMRPIDRSSGSGGVRAS
jgi:hypothetical protein